MKEKISKIINLIVLIAVVFAIVFFAVRNIPSAMIGKANETANSNIQSIEKVNEELSALAPGARFDTAGEVGHLVKGNGYTRVVAESVAKQIYCAMKGGSLNAHGPSYEQVSSYANSLRGQNTGWHRSFRHHSYVNNQNYLSRAYYEVTESRAANYAESYILTWNDPPFTADWNEWTATKQEAVWDMSSLSTNRRAPKPSVAGAVADLISPQATAYMHFMLNIQANGNKIVVGNETNEANVRVNANYSTQEYVVGPFKINYIDGDYTGIVFGGISDMYAITESGARIDIKSFIINGQEITPNYFDPLGTAYVSPGNGQYKQLYPKTKVVEGKRVADEFYIKINATSDEHIAKIHADFEWMEAQSQITYYNAYKYRAIVTSHRRDTKTVNDGTDSNVHTKSHKEYKCTITGTGIRKEGTGFQRLLSATGRRDLHKESLEINVPNYQPQQPQQPKQPGGDDSNNPPPTPDKNLRMKLAGHVFEEIKNGKDSRIDGVKDGKNVNDIYKEGVEVYLYYSDGTLVTRDANRNRLQNPTVTDYNGYYEFNDLDDKRKYYIEFVYDGQIYQATNYTGINLNGGYSNAAEVPSQRTAYNNHFAEIGSAPGSYVVRRGRYIEEGNTNSAWIISKSSSETPYGIKEIYEELITSAVKNKSYDAAFREIERKYSSDSNIKSKLQFIEDCRISSFTGANGSKALFPIYDQFIDESVANDNEAEAKKFGKGKYNGYEGYFKTVGGIRYFALYPQHWNIDFGLTKRETFDMALRKDIEKATIEINGKSHVYTYDTRKNADETDDGTWDISVRLSDGYYNTKYSRELFAEDYQYKASMYGDNSSIYGKDKSDELEVYVTYKLTVRNQSQQILGEITELVDYYDEDYIFVNDRSYIQIKRGNNQGIYDTKASAESRYGASNSIEPNGYDALYVRGLEGIKLTSGQTAYIYLTFKVKKDNLNNEDWVRLDEEISSASPIGVGKENIAEINGFRTYYANGVEVPNKGNVSGNVAGLFDYDAVAGNLNKNDVPKDGTINNKNFEDDTDKAPNIRLILYRDGNGLIYRQIDGIVWEDERNEINNLQATAVGDGIKQNNETSINGVTVQLVELMDNGTEFIWKQFSTGQGVYEPIINIDNKGNGQGLIPNASDNTTGKYIFRSYMPGNYVVRFIYGDTVKTVLPNTSTDITNAFGAQGQNAKSYNGQDYKSTTYQEGIDQNASVAGRNSNFWSSENGRLTYHWKKDSTWNLGQESIPKEDITAIQTFKSDYSNNETVNARVSANAQQGYLYDITASATNVNVSDAKDIMKDDNVNTPNGRQSTTLNSREDVIDYSDNDVRNYLAEVLASHEQMPLNQAELKAKLEELMKETQMTAETGMIVVELEYDSTTTDTETKEGQQKQGNYKINDVNLGLEERPKAQLSVDKKVTNVRLTLADGSTLFDASQKATNVLWRNHKPHEFNIRGSKLAQNPMTQIRDFDAQYGLIQMSMDEELMHGATIKISYEVTVTNVGEVDYKENSFYYTGNVLNPTTVVKTEPNQLIDYVANNLQFYKVDNNVWEVIDKSELMKENTRESLVNNTLKEQVEKYNTVITTTADSNIAKAKLVPLMYDSERAAVSDDLVLTQLITSENNTDDLTYRNIVELVKTSNDVGRRNAYSVVGNQDPTLDVKEVDTDVAQIVKILPPFGNGGTPYIIAAIVLTSSLILIAGIVFIKKKVLK